MALQTSGLTSKGDSFNPNKRREKDYKLLTFFFSRHIEKIVLFNPTILLSPRYSRSRASAVVLWRFWYYFISTYRFLSMERLVHVWFASNHVLKKSAQVKMLWFLLEQVRVNSVFHTFWVITNYHHSYILVSKTN